MNFTPYQTKNASYIFSGKITFRSCFYNIYKNRNKLLSADLETTQRTHLPKTNITKRDEVLRKFESDMRVEIGKLEAKMKIGWSTLRVLAKHLRSNNYPDEEVLKKLKFSKGYLQQFVKRHEVNFTRKKSNQKKISKEELYELRKPINAKLSRFSKDRLINMDETGEAYADSHQKGTFTLEKDMDNFKARCFRHSKN